MRFYALACDLPMAPWLGVAAPALRHSTRYGAYAKPAESSSSSRVDCYQIWSRSWSRSTCSIESSRRTARRSTHSDRTPGAGQQVVELHAS
jgi:hypothetical protein